MHPETTYSFDPGTENVKRHLTAIKWIGISFIIVITITVPVLSGILTMGRGEQRLDYAVHELNNATACNYSKIHDLGERVYLTVCSINGHIVLDIRRFVNNSATITGIPLNWEQWTTLKGHVHIVDDDIREAQTLDPRSLANPKRN
jgi:hypothetical protein